jgi:hypothetical protein
MLVYLWVIILTASHMAAFFLGMYRASNEVEAELRKVQREMDFYIAQYRATKVRQGTSEPHPSFRRSGSLKPH